MQPLLRVASPTVSWLRLALPGIAVAAILTLLAKGLATELAGGIGGLPKLPISPVMCAVVLGMLWRNTLGVPTVATEGLQWVMRGLLRTGIALVGLRLTLSGATAIAVDALPVALSCICVGLLGATFDRAALWRAAAARGAPRRGHGRVRLHGGHRGFARDPRAQR